MLQRPTPSTQLAPQHPSRATSPGPSTPSASPAPPTTIQRTTMLATPRPITRQNLQLPKPTAGTTGAATAATAPIAAVSTTATSPGLGPTIMNNIRRGIAAVKSTSSSLIDKPQHSLDHASADVTLSPPSTASMNNSRPASPSPQSQAATGTTTGTSSSPSTTGAKTENVTVTVRIRPFSSSELRAAGGPTEVWDVSDDGSKIGYADDYAVQARRAPVEYIFDHALTGSDNEEIYNSSVKNLVQSAMEGYNGTVFAYGQTSSGKTYSGNETQPGITPRAIEDIFKYIRENPDREFLLRVSYLEIYNESIRDLLSPEAIDLKIHEDRRRGVYVSPLKEEIVTTPSQVMRIIERGNDQRHVSATDFNAHSSRSHSIFQIVIESRDRSAASSGSSTPRKPAGAKPAAAVRVSQLNLIDLAGSEKATSNEERRKEGAFINKSLLTLGTVISKLTEEKGAHIPYRDSKLTRILQSSLNGNARVSVICTISPSSLNVEESNNTLKFAARVKKVVTKAQTNSVMDDKALLEKYRREISELKAQLMATVSNGSDVIGVGGDNNAGGKQAELSTLLEKERLKHEEEMLEMNMVRNALKERIDHLTTLILTSQSINTKSAAPERPISRYTVETSADGTVLEFPKEIESRLAHKDALVKQLKSEVEMQQEKMALMRVAIEKTLKGESVDLEKTLVKVLEDPPREKLLNEKRASIMSAHSLEPISETGNNVDITAPRSIQLGKGDKAARSLPNAGLTGDDNKSYLNLNEDENEDDDLLDTPWNREELRNLRQVKRELEVVVVAQTKKLEDVLNSVPFEDSDEFRDMVIEMEEQREEIVTLKEERERLRMKVTELKNTIRRMEQGGSSSTSLSSDAADMTSGSLGRSTDPGTPVNAKIKELEMIAQKERRLRMDEQARSMGRIDSLEAKLTMLKAELSVYKLAAYE
ncbi:hypothetical protein BX616_006261 [Lobosporangium transversale]|nr:hypothetical protein BX616_006261 [Lobosporangium transversale]